MAEAGSSGAARRGDARNVHESSCGAGVGVGDPHGIGPGCAGRHVGNLGRRAMYLPPVLRPLAVAGPEPPAAQLLAEAAVSVVRGAPGSYAAERLADVVRGWGRWGDSVWLRLRDVRSTDLAGSLAAACQHRWSHADDGTGPTIVAADLRGTLDEGPDGGVVVIELGGRATPEVVELIGTIRPTVTRRRIRVIVVAESRWRPPVRPDSCHRGASSTRQMAFTAGFGAMADTFLQVSALRVVSSRE